MKNKKKNEDILFKVFKNSIKIVKKLQRAIESTTSKKTKTKKKLKQTKNK